MLFIVEKDGKIRESDTSAHLHVFIAIKYQSQKLDYILTTFWTRSACFSPSVFILCWHVADRQCELHVYSRVVQLRMDMPLGEPKLRKACPLKGQVQASNHCSIPPKLFPELQDGEREAHWLREAALLGKGALHAAQCKWIFSVPRSCLQRTSWPAWGMSMPQPIASWGLNLSCWHS